MTWKDLGERFKSPVVVAQLIWDTAAFAYLILRLMHKIDIDQATWDIVIGAITFLFNKFAGLNDPTNRKAF